MLDNIVKVKGLPFKANRGDVQEFFQQGTAGLGSSIKEDGISFVLHADGRPTGMAFVAFDGLDEARRATQKDRETFGDKFGDRYVRVYPALATDEAEMQQAVLQQNMMQQVSGHGYTDSVVKIKSLPFDANQLDIIQFFKGYKLKPNGVQLVVRSDNKPTGEAFVDLESPEEAGRAIREKDHRVFSDKFGDRYVRLIQVSRKEMQATLALRFGGEGILKIKGIPFKAQASDVRKFFGAYKIKPGGISFIMHADGRPTGMAFIEFETPQEAVRAMEKDRAKFGPEYGDRFCMLQLVGRHEMDKVQLQRENDVNIPSKVLNGISTLQAAAIATQAALNNPALRPLMQQQQQQQSGPLFAANGISPAAAIQLGLLQPPLSPSPLAVSSNQLASSQLMATSQPQPGPLPLPFLGAQVPPLPASQPLPDAAAAAVATSTSPLLDAQLALQLSGQLPLDPGPNPLLFYSQPLGSDFVRPEARCGPQHTLMADALQEPLLAAAATNPMQTFPGPAAAI